MEFCENIAPKLGWHAMINPEKKNDKTAPDLILNRELVVDLKSKFSPFFKAGMMYGISPQYAIAFGVHTYERYQRADFVKRYGDLPIVFWVRWDLLKWQNISVTPMHGIWFISMSELAAIKERRDAPLHIYSDRVKAGMYADRVYIFDLRDLHVYTMLEESRHEGY